MITKFKPEKMVDTEFKTGDWFWDQERHNLMVLTAVNGYYAFVCTDGQPWSVRPSLGAAIQNAHDEDFQYIGKACDVAKRIKFFVDNVDV